MMDPLKDLREVAETWKRDGRDREFTRGQLVQLSKNEQAVKFVLDEYFPVAVVVAPKSGHTPPSELAEAERIDRASTASEIADAVIESAKQPAPEPVNPILQAALRCVEKGWYVFALQERGK